jgi:hypothetical protein
MNLAKIKFIFNTCICCFFTTLAISQTHIFVDTVFTDVEPLQGWVQPDSATFQDQVVVTFLNGIGFYKYAEEWELKSFVNQNVVVTSSIDSLKLKATKGLVYVKSYYHGLGYGGGIFHWSDEESLDEDGGLVFDHIEEGHWIRKDRNFKASYFGAVDEEDLSSIGKKHSGNEILNMYNAAPDRSTLYFDSGFTFVDYRGLKLSKEISISGYGSILKVGDQISTTLVSPPNNSNVINVNSLNGLEVGMSVAVPNGSNSTPNVVITQIDGNSLTLSQSISSSQLVLTTSITSIVAAASASGSTVKNVVIEGLTIDGNRENNSSWAWWQNQIGIYMISNFTTLNDLIIKNAQCEGILFGGEHSKMSNISIENCGGNGIHLGAANYWSATNISIIGCQQFEGDSGHEDGGFILSNDCENGVLTNLYVEDALSVLGSIDSEANGNNTFTNIRGRNCDFFIEGAGSINTGGDRTKNTIVSNFYGINCGSIRMDYSENVLICDGILEFTEENTFYDSSVIFDRNSINNTYRNISIHFANDSINTAIRVETGSRYIIENCKIFGGKHGITATNNTNEVLIRNCLIDNSRQLGIIIGGERSIVENNRIICEDGYVDYRSIYSTGGVIIDDNKIDIYNDISGSYGILVASSVEGRSLIKNNIVRNTENNNTIRFQSSVSNAIAVGNLVSKDIFDLGTNNTLVQNHIITSN